MPDPILTVRLETLGRETTRVGSWRITSEFTRSTDDFEIELIDTDPANLRGLELQPVELTLSGLFVNGASQVLGRIDQTERGDSAVTVTCRGRDFVADVVECHLDPTFKVAKDAILVDAILDACRPAGISMVLGESDLATRNIRTGRAISGAKPGPAFREIKLDELKPEPGLGCYEWANRIAARNGATIQPAAERGVLCLAVPDYDQAPLYTLRRSADGITGKRNNVVSASAVRDFSSLPTYLLFSGKAQNATGKSGPLAKEWTIQDVCRMIPELANIAGTNCHVGRLKFGQELSDAPKLYRLAYQDDDECKNAAQIEALARRAFAERLKETLVYAVTVKGFEDPTTGALYTCNTIVDVQDEIADVAEPMWIASRTFSYDAQAGAQTRLECWRLETFLVGD